MRRRIIRGAALALCVLSAAYADALSTTTTTGGVGPESPVIQLASTSGAAVGYEMYLDREAMVIIGVSTDSVTVRRGQEGTAARSHASGASVWVGPSRLFSYGDLTGSGCTSRAAVGETLLAIRTGSQWTCGANDVWGAATSSSGGWTDDGTTTSTTRNVAIGGAVSGRPVSALSINGTPQTYSVTAFQDNGLARVVQSRPDSETKRIVILGSSNASGTNASSYANSWAGKFETAMTARGWTVINVSIGGQNTGNAISRFWTDVAPLKPDIVIHAMAYRNQSYDYATYTANTLRLIRMTEQIGAVPVVMGQYGDSLATADNCKSIMALERWKENIGVPTWNWLAATADPTNCHWLPGMDSGDGIHPNDTGYEAQFNAIPLNMFDRLLAQRGQQAPLPRPGVWQWSVSDSTNNPLYVPLDRSTHSWTIAAFIRDGAVNFKGMMSVFTSGGANQLGRVRNSGNVVQWTSNVGTLDLPTSYTAINRFWYHIAVTYNGGTQVLSLYVNGQLAGSGATGSDFSMDGVRFLSNLTVQQLLGGQLAQPVIYRVALPEDQIYALSRGAVLRAGLEWYSSLSGAPTTQLVSDLGTTTVATVYADSWTPVVGQFPFPLTLIPTVAPTCDSDHSGQVIYSGHVSGVKDTVRVCAADAADAYAWRTIY